jgi:alanyl-tRNA synthetase
VGYTARHHTFFEMMGNFSFGDYFKEDAILFAWEVITKELCIPKEKLVVTVYHDDDEAVALWKKIGGFSDDKIIRIATDDNFWMMGPTGPCGPSSEIFYDHGEHIWGGPPGSPEEDGDRFVEIWNLVFMQYEQFEDGTRKALAAQSIDTGMGIERVAALLQGTNDNYATDLVRNLIEASAQATSSDPDGPHKTSSSGHCRPPALDILSDCRRSFAVKRWPWLCAAADHAPRDASCAFDRGCRSSDASSGARLWSSKWALPILNWCRRNR